MRTEKASIKIRLITCNRHILSRPSPGRKSASTTERSYSCADVLRKICHTQREVRQLANFRLESESTVLVRSYSRGSCWRSCSGRSCASQLPSASRVRWKGRLLKVKKMLIINKLIWFFYQKIFFRILSWIKKVCGQN